VEQVEKEILRHGLSLCPENDHRVADLDFLPPRATKKPVEGGTVGECRPLADWGVEVLIFFIRSERIEIERYERRPGSLRPRDTLYGLVEPGYRSIRSGYETHSLKFRSLARAVANPAATHFRTVMDVLKFSVQAENHVRASHFIPVR